MPSYSVSRSLHAVTLPAVADTVIFAASYPSVSVLNRSGVHLYVTTDGSTAEIGGNECFVVPPQSVAQVPVVAPVSGTAPATTQISLISNTVAIYSVTTFPYTISAISTASDGGTGGSSMEIGTTPGTVAAGDDIRIVGAAQKAANLTDLVDVSAARTNLGLGTAALSASSDFDPAGSSDSVQATLTNLPMRLPARLFSNIVSSSTATLPATGTGALLASTVADGVLGRVGAQIELPSAWSTVNVQVLWTVTGTPLTGNVSLAGSVCNIIPGTALTAGTTSTPVSVSVPATASVPVETDLGNFTGYVTNQWMWAFSIVCDRTADTFNGTLALLGLRITPV